ncbi:MAG: hypothetical protein KIS86_04630 [Devosia sp.]|nr:hypothetical protein [Devosia sp.]
MSEPILPPLMVEIAEVAGISAAWALVRSRGGTKVYIPHDVRQDHWLAQLVGLEEGRLICQRFGGNDIILPNAKAQQVRQAMVDALNAGATTNEVARQTGMTTRTVFRVKAELKRDGDPRQGRLFD